ncbi:toprim domain-containing protein [Piscibacillus halophilus]|mgnify:CR=1 FL=1|uniref:Toprim domain protein n=1 Tax=Piscibacillus halophilus TaxID=571933 RepID=A0A1H9ESL9_9BACI|nr:toprim domain-containing protein [Piscibacillus halophilus]SEQ28684.1 toprim domain protein [Piscibacillus halophilus]
MDETSRVLIVEGKQDRKKIQKILDDEDVFILCTFGTLGIDALEHLVDDYHLFDRDVYIFTDTDEPGEKLRKMLNRELSHARNIYIDKKYREVEDTPEPVLASILQAANMKVKVEYLKGF